MKKNAFTLIELMIVIAIIGIIAAIVLPAMASAQRRANALKAAQIAQTNNPTMVGSTNIVDEPLTNNTDIHIGDLVMIKSINVVGVVNRDAMGYFDIITTNIVIDGPHEVVTQIEGISPEILVKLKATNSIKTNIVEIEKGQKQ